MRGNKLGVEAKIEVPAMVAWSRWGDVIHLASQVCLHDIATTANQKRQKIVVWSDEAKET